MTRPNVLARRPRPTQNAYRSAVARIVRDLKAQHSLSNTELADRVGCSDGTIENAENQRASLSAEILMKIEHEFGSGTINPVMALGGSRAVDEGARCEGDVLPPLTAAVFHIARSRDPNSPGGVVTIIDEVRAMEADLRAAQHRISTMLAMLDQEVAA